ncbi:CG3342 [Drosophila busckii]|uniref:CG3342 n=1 Tax=Drosophila busckii TaxID=30019 RepID=A0A0M3QYX6_DROBS|nr:uncharacterized protein LOC108605735 [Drosophila busckii]ALC48443.1 CG3342 [Drosophila busckii]
MESIRDTSHDEFFDKLNSSDNPRNLRQIFEEDCQSLRRESSNLHYNPMPPPLYKRKPQPSNKQESTSMATWSTVIAKVTTGYNGNDNVGRVGLALSRNSAGAAKLVVYKTRNDLLSTLLLTKSTSSGSPRGGPSNLIVRESYMQFYDDSQRFWSLRFENTKDEDEFTDELTKLGLPVVTRHNNNGKANEGKESPSSATGTGTNNSVSDSESESTPSTEEIVNPEQKSEQQREINETLGPLDRITSEIPLAVKEQAIVAMSKLVINRAVAEGLSRDDKMDTLLQAMCRLANSSTNSTTKTSQVSSADNTVSSTMVLADNEDELLELEQKLLNFKKENRALIKNLKLKEQALEDLRSSTCALCEQLLGQNNELKMQNTDLLTAMTAHSTANFAVNGCSKCEQYLTKIEHLERRIATLQMTLMECAANGNPGANAVLPAP